MGDIYESLQASDYAEDATFGAKAKKMDVRGMAWLHVDIAPRPNEPIEQERERALRVLRTFSPPPTIIVDSGGGYQGFWRLDKEHPINGDLAVAAELEAYIGRSLKPATRAVPR